MRGGGEGRILFIDNGELAGYRHVKPIVYLLCEIKSRDLHSRLLIADYLRARGYPVVIGQIWAILGAIGSPSLPPGVCLFATANKFQVRGMRIVRERGCIVVGMDEESLNLAGERMLVGLDPQALDVCDLFLANSDEHKKRLGDGPAIHVTGSARFERIITLVYQRPISYDYVLFNTGFTLHNTTHSSPSAAANLAIKAGRTIEETQERARIEAANLELTVGLMKWVLENTQLHIVIRPHPAEKAETWQNLAGQNPRIIVVPQSDPLPWVKFAKALVHADSTTGLEAAFLGTPCVNLTPFLDWSRQFVVHQVNALARTMEDATKVLLEALQGRQKVAKPPFPADGGRHIADILASLLPPPSPVVTLPWEGPPRTALERDKFAATLDEIGRHAVELHESVFLIPPSISS